jgi:anti-sigma B factor antagonist
MDSPEPPSTVVVTLAEVDVDNADQLRTQLARAVKRYVEAPGEHVEPLTIDLSAVQFLDSTGVAAILDADRSVRPVGGRIELVGVQHAVQRILEVTGVWEQLHTSGRPMDIPWHRGLR